MKWVKNNKIKSVFIYNVFAMIVLSNIINRDELIIVDTMYFFTSHIPFFIYNFVFFSLVLKGSEIDNFKRGNQKEKVVSLLLAFAMISYYFIGIASLVGSEMEMGKLLLYACASSIFITFFIWYARGLYMELFIKKKE